MAQTKHSNKRRQTKSQTSGDDNPKCYRPGIIELFEVQPFQHVVRQILTDLRYKAAEMYLLHFPKI